MALDPTKKKSPEEIARLQAVANPYGDSMASKVGQAIAGFKSNYNATQDAADALVASRRPVKPSFAGVQGTPAQGAVTIPAQQATTARNPASPAPLAGASAPAGGVPAPSLVRPLTGGGAGPAQAGFQSVASSVNAQGNNVYDNASIERLNARNGVAPGAVASPVALAAPQLAPQPNMAVNLPRPVVADAYNTRQANDAQTALASEIGSQLFRNSFAAGRGSRTARDLQGQLVQTLAGIGGKQLDVAANVAGGNRDTAAKYDLTGVEQTGANQRALLGDTGDTNRTLIGEQGANARESMRASTELSKPSQITDADGNVLSIVGNTATPITVGGKPLRAPATKAEGAITPAIQLDALTKQLEAEAGALEPSQERIGALQQQINSLMAGNSGGQGAPSAKPASQQEYLAKARAANPGVSDQEHIRRYNEKYGQAK